MTNDPTQEAPALNIPFAEFVALIALMTSLVALSIDSMLPALAAMGQELGVANINDTQLVISSIFLGMALAQIFYGPLADAYGRKPAIYFGLLLFIVGCIISAVAESFTMILVSRVLQGIGIASPRVITMAIVRDLFEGRGMARVMSFTMSIFILVPIIAPALGQGVMMLAGWRAIFWVVAGLAVMVLLWFGIRQQETLIPAKRIPLSFKALRASLSVIFRDRIAMGYTVMSGLIFGAFLGYLSSAQQIFQNIYPTGDWFPLLFAVLAVSIGAASIYNGKHVIKLGMRFLTQRSLIWLTVVSLLFILPVMVWNGIPPLPLFLLYMLVSFFHIGILFGNMTSLAMEPLGKLAGIGAGVVGSVSTLISVPLGILTGRFMEASVLPLVLGFMLAGAVSLLMMRWLR